MLIRLSHPRQGLSRPEVPQQLGHVGSASLPTQGELPVFKPWLFLLTLLALLHMQWTEA
jgi:hypothetical protein